MPRLQLFEIEDQSWCPRAVRDGLTDFLQAMQEATRPYDVVAPKLSAALAAAGTRRIVDIGAGAGGPWAGLLAQVDVRGGAPSVVLTDVDPNLDAMQHAAARSNGAVSAVTTPIDARAVPAELTGLRTFFSSFHHLCPDDARRALRDAFGHQQGIAIFEATRRDPVAIVLTALFAPLATLLFTPTIRPFRWSRLLFTYAIPAIPLAVAFDGVVSCLRTYSIDEMKELFRDAAPGGWATCVGELRAKGALIPITYAIAVPPTAATSWTDS